jgi:hypothetical protein
VIELVVLLTKVGKHVFKYAFQYLALLLVCTNLATYSFWQDARTDLKAEQDAHAATIQEFKTKQEVANARAEAIKQTLLDEAKKDAKQADANYASLLSKYNASILRYQTSQSGASRPDNYQLPATQGGDGPGGSTELPVEVIISLADAKICAVNTARLQAVQAWAVNLPK